MKYSTLVMLQARTTSLPEVYPVAGLLRRMWQKAKKKMPNFMGEDNLS